MPDSPFADSFDEARFYTESSDKHHHSERGNFRAPGDWFHFASVVANSPLCPEYQSVSDIMRDGFAKAISVALQHVNDPEAVAKWNVHLAIAELEWRKSQDEREEALAELWSDRMRENHGWTPAEFQLARTAMSNPDAIEIMNRLGSRYNL